MEGEGFELIGIFSADIQLFDGFWVRLRPFKFGLPRRFSGGQLTDYGEVPITVKLPRRPDRTANRYPKDAAGSNLLYDSSPVIYLLLQIVFASAFTLLLKWVQLRPKDDVVTAGAINYITAAVVSIPVFLIYNPQPAAFGAIWTGGAMGTLYFIAFFFVIYAIEKVGASSTTVVSVLSISMPIAFGALFFDERPTLLQVVGIVLAMVSLTLITGSKQKAAEEVGAEGDGPAPSDSESRSAIGDPNSANPKDALPEQSAPVNRWIVPTVLIVFFLLCGFNRMLQDAFKQYDEPLHRPAFLLAGFTMAALPSLVVLYRNRRWPRITEWAFGIVIGLSNLLQTFFILRALQRLEGYIVFTLTSGGAIVLTTLVATGCLGERLNRRTQVGITLAVLALFLLCWLPD